MAVELIVELDGLVEVKGLVEVGGLVKLKLPLIVGGLLKLYCSSRSLVVWRSVGWSVGRSGYVCE